MFPELVNFFFNCNRIIVREICFYKFVICNAYFIIYLKTSFSMVGIVQVFVLLLILVSFALVVAVPVILATPGEWEKSQSIVWSGAGIWSALVILTGIFNVVPA